VREKYDVTAIISDAAMSDLMKIARKKKCSPEQALQKALYYYLEHLNQNEED